LRNHAEKSRKDLSYRDAELGRKFIPHVIEPTFGMDRSVLAVLIDAYTKEEVNGKTRVVLKMKPALAPYKVAVFPLLANKPELMEKAQGLYKDLKQNTNGAITFDPRGNIGKRYLAQDEIGTPWCVTVDFESLEDEHVTVRDRDTMQQERVAIKELLSYFNKKLTA